MKKPKLRWIVLALKILLLAAILGWKSDSPKQRPYPNREITIVVPFGEGGGTDGFARVMKNTIDKNELLPTPVVVKNMDGAGATVGSRYVKDAKPDGYTILLLHDAILTAKASGKVGYGAESFDLIAGTAEFGMVIAVAESGEGDADFESLTGLLEAAKGSPDTVKFGVNLGALTHYAAAELAQQVPGCQFLYVQCGGGADRFSKLIGGHIDVTGFSIEEFNRFRSEGLRGIAYLGPQPHGSAPDVPTAREQGFDVVYDNMFYWWAPKGTPQKRIDVLADALEKAMTTPMMKRELAKIRCEGTFLSGDLARERIDASAAQYENVEIGEITVLPNIPGIILFATIGMFSLVVVESTLRRVRTIPVRSSVHEGRSRVSANSWLRMGATVLLSGIYFLVMAQAWVSFAVASSTYIAIVALLLSNFRWKYLPDYALDGCLIGFGLSRLMSEVLAVTIA